VQKLLEKTETGDFAEFVAARSGRLLRVAYLLTRDWALAEDLLQTSLAKAWSAWRRIEGDPEPYVRKILVNTYTSWWRRRWTAERPTQDLPEYPGADRHREVDDRDQVARALHRLPRQQRAVLVLRYYEDMSEAEIAETLHISPGTVKSHAVKALANLRLDPSLATAHLQPGPEPAGTARLAAVAERVHQRRRQKVTAAVAACAVVLAALLGYAIRPSHRSAPQPATSPSTVNGFFRFHQGTELATTATLSPSRPQAQLRWRPKTADVTFFVRCTAAQPGVLVFIGFTVGTTRLGEVGCEGVAHPAGSGAGATWSASTLADAGLLEGGTVDVRISRAVRADDQKAAPAPVQVPADFVADIAVGEAMGFDAYPFPSAPAQLPALTANGFDHRDGSIRVSRDPADPLRPVSVEIPWREWDIHVALDAPGWLTLSVNGNEFSRCEKWDYSEGGCGDTTGPSDPRLKGFGLSSGATVTVTVTPQRVGHAWEVWLAPRG